MIRRYNHPVRAFTLTELLVVALIVTTALGIAIPLYSSSQHHAQRAVCEANLMAIYQAEEAYRVRSSSRQYTTNMADLNSALGSAPRCPVHNTAYILAVGSDGINVTCPERSAHAANKYLRYSNGAVTEVTTP
jgi:Tfp pilus assembly protein PilE